MHHADVLTRVLKILGKRGSLICFTVLIQKIDFLVKSTIKEHYHLH